jgi:hypothetical protein
MTDTTEAPRNAAGEFAEPAFGRASLERDAGFVPLPEEKEEAPELSTAEAAEQRLRELSGSESKIITHTTGLDDNVSMTLDQAADALADSREADHEQAKLDDVKAQQKEIDKLRGVKNEAPAVDAEIDIEKTLSNPRIRDAIAERVGAAEAERTRYESAVEAAGKMQIAAIAADFPDLANTPLDQWANAINTMAQTDPARARVVHGRLQHLAQVEAAANQIKADKSAREQAEFRQYSAREDARFAELTSDIPAKQMAEVRAHVPKMLNKLGADVPTFLRAIEAQTTFPRGVAEALLVRAARYELLMAAPKAVAAREIPTVQKPGHVGPRNANPRGAADLAQLSARLKNSGSLKDAVALRAAQIKRR